MPTIRVELFEGRTPEQKRNLVAALTEAAVKKARQLKYIPSACSLRWRPLAELS